MPLSLQESIRLKMKSVAKLYEIFVMKSYMQVQSEVLQNVAKHFGYNDISNINDFLTSPMGQFSMKAYRKILLDKYGEDPKKPNNPNTDTDPGFFGKDDAAREKIIKDITNSIIILYNKETSNVKA